MEPLLITIIIIVLTLTLAYFICVGVRGYMNRIRFQKIVDTISQQVGELLAQLDEMFQPKHRVEKAQIDAFVEANSRTIETAKDIINDPQKVDSILEKNGILEFLDQVDEESLKTRLEVNHETYDNIEEFNNLSHQALSQYEAYMQPHHYFAYSEMEGFLASLNRFDELCKKLLPQYEESISEESYKDIIKIKTVIEQERTQHNEAFVAQELDDCKTYFDTVLGKYPLDPQQRDSIVKLEDNCLVIASAGSGKTSTILGKAKYLVEKRGISPSKILLLTYTKKAALELQERMKIEGVTCSTFHSIAYRIIAQVTGQAPSICENDLALNVFHHLIKTNKDFLHAINNYIINLQSLMMLEHDYLDAFSYFEDRKKYGIQALFPDVDEKMIFTRSEEEKRLVSILTRLGVPFRYENLYEHDTRTPERQQYRPDFTIYYQDATGKWKWLYLEHFAIDDRGNVPRWFGEGTKGGWFAANKRYLESIDWKRATHEKYGTILIETKSADFRNGTVEEKLIQQLKKYGVPIKEREDEDIYQLLVKRNRKLEKSVFTLILSFITLMKANEKTIEGLLEELNNQYSTEEEPYNIKRNRIVLTEVIKPFYEEYQKELDRQYQIDFTDAIIQATAICRQGLWQDYSYILVDEFQDISIDRYKLLQALRSESPKTKLYCVGDDWQSIFRFAGSDMSLVYDFEEYFGYTEHCKIETTYRFHHPLIEHSSGFIMRNQQQKEKTIKTPKGDLNVTHLHFMAYEGDDGVLEKVKDILSSLPKEQSVLFLGRYNYDAISLGFNGKIDMNDNRIMVNIDGKEYPFLSVHSAKGLEADYVILVNCNQGAYGFPSLIEDDPVLDFVLSKSESYPFAEERRLFYVAMTRARSRMYVLYDKKRPSPFISEFKLNVDIGSYLCPKCLEGKMIAIKDGVTTKGDAYRSYVCSNQEGGCDFFETKYGNLTPPGIEITEEMTAQDIEKLRENRRKAKLSQLPHAPKTEFTYKSQAPVFKHQSISGFK